MVFKNLLLGGGLLGSGLLGLGGLSLLLLLGGSLLLGCGLLGGSLLFSGSQLEGARSTLTLGLDEGLLLNHGLDGLLDEGGKLDGVNLVFGSDVLLDGGEGRAVPLLQGLDGGLNHGGGGWVSRGSLGLLLSLSLGGLGLGGLLGGGGGSGGLGGGGSGSFFSHFRVEECSCWIAKSN